MQKIKILAVVLGVVLFSFSAFCSTLTEQVSDGSDSVFNTTGTSELSDHNSTDEADTPEMDFSDLNYHWANDFVEELYLSGVVNGKEDGLFHPDDFITRAELTKIALLGYEYSVESSVSEKPFSDVEILEWYAPFVAKAKELALVGGYADGTFKPKENITRAEALKILAKAGGLDTALNGGVSEFSDVPSNAWYFDYVRMAVGMGVVNGYGDNTFRPNAYITRAEASKILVKFLEVQ
ncbi:MAG: S-layer homology domain-containing protein [Candidatus Gracilibacteria bacterium]|jgi:hypothetical protein|nr:S-layer homology domain-containing protein [Candidatus Gracilibacteria bacterium]